MVRTIRDLEVLLQASRTGQRMPKSQLTLAIPALNESQRLGAQRKLNAFAHTCGCAEGGVCALASLSIVLSYSVLGPRHYSGQRLVTLWLAGICFILLSAGIGKAVGLFIGRLRFRRTCVRLIQVLSGPSLSVSTEEANPI